MKPIFSRMAILLLLISIGLSSCQLFSSSEPEQDESMVQTMVALAFTQTAIAEMQVIEVTETPEATITPPELEVEEPTPTQEIVHQIRPGEPGWAVRWFYDTDSSTTGSAGYATGGDDFIANLYERPFTEGEMVYRPDIDIIRADISSDNTFIYVKIQVKGTHPEGDFQAAYGVEIDHDLDGRGDILVVADRPTSSGWSIAGVSVYQDLNKDVGGATILRPDTNYQGDGYEHILFSMDNLADPDIAWARVSPGTPSTVYLAFKKSIVPRNNFVWGVWAAENLLDPALFDLHDHFTAAEAGSPYRSHSTYPLAAVNLVDNTCRETFNFEPTGPIRGLCIQPEVVPTATPEPLTGTIHGVAFDDLDNNGSRQEGEPLTIYTITVSLRQGTCGDPVIATTSNKAFSFSGLQAGDYCVSISPSGSMTTASSRSVTLPAGGSVYVEFGYYVVQ